MLTYDRIAVARRRDSIPSCTIKSSKKHPRQQKALDRLAESAKDRFDERLVSLLNQSGVKETHKGTYVISPEDWSRFAWSIYIVHTQNSARGRKRPAQLK